MIYRYTMGDYVYYKNELRRIIGQVVVDYDVKYLLAADEKRGLVEVYANEMDLTTERD